MEENGMRMESYLRKKIGLVNQSPFLFNASIKDNIGYGLKHLTMDQIEHAANQSQAMEFIKKLPNGFDTIVGERGQTLSGGQQQRLCIARALAMEPEIILMDEPCSALDPVSTAHIEDLLFELKTEYTIVIVTHNMQQAARVSDYTAFMENGVLVEFDETETVFTKPTQSRTEEYVTGRFG